MVPAPTFAPFHHLFSPSFPLMTHNNTNNNSLQPADESTATTSTNNQTLSTSKDLTTLHDPASADKGWLRLSIGDVHHHHHHNNNNNNHHLPQPPAFGLKLNQSFGVGDFSPGLVLPHPPPDLNWTLRPISSHNNSSSSNCSSFIPFGPYFSPPFHLHPGLDLVAATAAAGPSSDSDAVRVIDPPRRPHSGIWFSLQPFELNQGKQPALPQRSSSYLRIKDGRMTVRLLIKYLVKKLRLDSESEVEIRCRGEKLEPCLTMQHIRDNIWCSKDSSFTLLPHSSTIDHIMVLHYATSNSSSPS